VNSIAEARVESEIPLPVEDTVPFPAPTVAVEGDPVDEDDPLDEVLAAAPAPPPMPEPPELASPVWGRAPAAPAVRSAATTYALARRVTISLSVLLLVVPTG
jgi:hypothetical protein